MKKFSLSGFKEYCERSFYNTIIFATENQTWNNVETPISMGLEFCKMIITLNPDTINLKNNNGFLKIKRVKCVKLHPEKCLLGEIFTVICEDISTKNGVIEYTLVAR